MTLDQVRERWAAATPGPWRIERSHLAMWVLSEDRMLEANLGYIGNRPENNATAIAHAPTDVGMLLGAVDAVLALAEEWRYKGEFGWGAWQEGHGPDPEGAALDHAAAAIRAAITAATQGEA